MWHYAPVTLATHEEALKMDAEDAAYVATLDAMPNH